VVCVVAGVIPTLREGGVCVVAGVVPTLVYGVGVKSKQIPSLMQRHNMAQIQSAILNEG
jgi:hypothetical protein